MAALAVVMAALAVGGCDSTSMSVDGPLSPGGLTGVSGGSYTLTTVNGSGLPYDVRNDASMRVSIVQGQLSFGAGGTFQQSITLSETPPSGTASVRQSATQGTATLRGGDRIEFRANDGGQWEGVISGNRINYSVPGNNGPVAFSFQRN
ncbi:MAG TPA: hypothetical protein VFS20_15050 [Longimicrobium sp.]|nr:hypothetical protein [Longimicrobium sp.]